MRHWCKATLICVCLQSNAYATSPSQGEEGINAAKTDSAPVQESPYKAKPIGKIVVVSHPIFDESAPDSFFIHRWANFLHINTTEATILNNLPFDEDSNISDKDIEEAQRLLRAEPYLRDAQISRSPKAPDADTDEPEALLVETWDNWSLLPTISLSKNGGDTKYSFGIKEDNLLGHGIRTDLKYQSSDDRSGYKVAVEAPLQFIKHAKVGVDFYDNSDGQATYAYFDKPFYTLDTKHQYSTYWIDDLRTDTIRQNGIDQYDFEHQVNYASVQYGHLFSYTHTHLTRVSVGFTQDKHEFTPNVTFPDAQLPKDRDFLYPWIGFEYLQDEYQVFNNVYLINANEDINLGWRHFFSIGIETNDIAQDADLGYHLKYQASRGWQSQDHLLLASLNAEADLQTSQEDFYNVSLKAEYFYHISDKWTAYAKTRLSSSDNNYLDRTFALGDETGIRGYPNDYQHGDNQWLVTGEIRNYPNINLYQLAELGWALFADAGQAFGGTDEFNEVNEVIGSIGIGARIYSSKSSYGNIAHLDLAKPFTNGQDVNEWEWRFEVKSHF